MTDQEKALVVREELTLTITNPVVTSISRHLRWRPVTTIARIERALPSILEQQIYLAIAPQIGESGLLPESLAKLLRIFLGSKELRLEDLTSGYPTSRNLDEFIEFLGECINLLKLITREYSTFSLRIDDAARIVLCYGTNDPERLIEMVDNELERICEVLNISNNISYSVRMGICVNIIATKVISENRKSGAPDLLDLTDFINMTSIKRHCIRKCVDQEVPDYLASDLHNLRSYDSLRLLKEEGML
ncbi:MAG: hypothetical protein ACYCZW_02205 [Minisyncoccota bacterium]